MKFKDLLLIVFVLICLGMLAIGGISGCDKCRDVIVNPVVRDTVVVHDTITVHYPHCKD